MFLIVRDKSLENIVDSLENTSKAMASRQYELFRDVHKRISLMLFDEEIPTNSFIDALPVTQDKAYSSVVVNSEIKNLKSFKVESRLINEKTYTFLLYGTDTMDESVGLKEALVELTDKPLPINILTPIRKKLVYLI